MVDQMPVRREPGVAVRRRRLLAGEGLRQRAGNSSQRHLYSAVRGHELNPGYQRAFDTGSHLIHSAQGFRRDDLIELAKPAGVFRVFVLGGSALYGIGVQSGTTYPVHPTLANDQTITFFLERELNARCAQQASTFRSRW